MEKDEILEGMISKKKFEFNNVAKRNLSVYFDQIFCLKIALNL